MKERIIRVKVRDESEIYYSEVGDLIIDHLLLRHLSSCVSYTCSNQIGLTHLIASNSLSEPFDESRNLSGIAPLIYEPSCCTFFQQFLRSLLNLFQCATKTVNKCLCDERSASVPGQLFASYYLLRVSIDSCRGEGLFEPVQLRFKILNLLLDIFKLLRPSVSVAHDSNSPD